MCHCTWASINLGHPSAMNDHSPQHCTVASTWVNPVLMNCDEYDVRRSLNIIRYCRYRHKSVQRKLVRFTRFIGVIPWLCVYDGHVRERCQCRQVCNRNTESGLQVRFVERWKRFAGTVRLHLGRQHVTVHEISQQKQDMLKGQRKFMPGNNNIEILAISLLPINKTSGYHIHDSSDVFKDRK